MLLEDSAEDALIKLLHESLFKDGKIHISSIVNPKLDLVPPCSKILRLLAEYNVRCRHKLAQDASVYDILFRHALLAPARGTVRYEVSCLVTLLLFDEVARCPLPDENQEKKSDIMFALPALVLKRYYIFCVCFKSYIAIFANDILLFISIDTVCHLTLQSTNCTILINVKN